MRSTSRQAEQVGSVKVAGVGGGLGLPGPATPAAPYFKDKCITVESRSLLEGDRQPGEKVTGRFKIAKCGCGSVWCSKCSVRKGLSVRDDLQRELRYFKSPYFLTFTLDRQLFPEGPEFAFQYIQKKRAVAELVKELRRLGYLNDSRHFCVIEFQTKTGDGWPHWHVVVDADFIPFEKLCNLWAQKGWSDARWGKRPPFVRGARPVLGSVQFRAKGKNDSARIVSYLTGYMTKAPAPSQNFPRGWPAWVLDREVAIRRWSCSRDFWRVCEHRNKAASAEEKQWAGLRREFGPGGEEHWEECDELELKPPRNRESVHARISRCGEKSVVCREVAKRNPFTREYEYFWEFAGVLSSDAWRNPEEQRCGGRGRLWSTACDITPTSFVVHGEDEVKILLSILHRWDL